MAKGEEHSSRKHRGSGDGGEDSESDSKRRKHYSRSSRHHHHWHRSKHRSDEQEAVRDRNVERPVAVARVDDEMEEGEILEAEDCLEVKGDSEAESGEIKPREAVEDASCLKSSAEEMLLCRSSSVSAEQDMCARKENNPLFERPKGTNLLSISQEDINVLEDGCIDRGILDENIEIIKGGLVHKISLSNGISENGSSAISNKTAPSASQMTFPGESSPRLIFEHEDASSGKCDKGRSEESLHNSPSAHTSSGGDHESNRSSLHGNDPRHAGLDVGMAVDKMNVDESFSPIPRDTVSTRHKGGDHYFSLGEHSGVSTSSTEGTSVKICSDSKEFKTNGSKSKKRSLSPESPTDKYGRRFLSPSDVARGRDQSPSHNLKRESASQSMDNLPDMNSTQVPEMKISKGKDQAKHSHYREEKINLMDLGKSSSRQKLREDYHDMYVDLDKEHSHRHSRGTSKDRSRNSVSSRHGEREENYDPQDKDLVKDKDKERRISSRDRGHEKDSERIRHRDRDKESDRVRDRDRDRDRESSRRHSQGRDREEDWVMERIRHGSQDRQRDRDTGRNRHDSRESSRELDLAREQDKEKSRYSFHSRDGRREMHRDRDRVWEKDQHMVKDRERDGNAPSRKYRHDSSEGHHSWRDKYMDSRHSKYDDVEHGKYNSRMRGPTKDPSGMNTEHGKEITTREEDEEEGFQERIALQLEEEEEEEDIEKIKEESRKRRQAILEKYKLQQSHQNEKPTDSIEMQSGDLSHTVDDASPIREVSSGDKHDLSNLPVAVSAFSVDKLPVQNGTLNSDKTSGEKGLGDGSPKSEKLEDMFCDDIFGESSAGFWKVGRGDGLPIDKSGLHDNWDDPEGYYNYRIGEVLDARYEITAGHGKGVFSTVVRAKDLKAGKGDPEEIAVKIIRNNETMYKAGMEEVNVLNKLVGADPEDRRHCVRFLSSFKYRNHLCLVFESLHMNLREVLKKFGRNIGLKLTAVRAYAKQLFIALKHLKNCGVLHCDIKPDNMLVSEAKNVLKLCDFGNAMFAGKNEVTPYLVSRFYRAPEIILGLPYDHALDIWSVGCCLYEIYTGKVLFPGPSNNDMLRLHMELKGPFPKKMLKKGAFTDHHFDQDLNFHATEEDPVTKKAVKRLLVNIKAKDFISLISTCPGEDPKMLANFKDLLDRIFVLDPEKRLTVSQALSHPFITGK